MKTDHETPKHVSKLAIKQAIKANKGIPVLSSLTGIEEDRLKGIAFELRNNAELSNTKFANEIFKYLEQMEIENKITLSEMKKGY